MVLLVLEARRVPLINILHTPLSLARAIWVHSLVIAIPVEISMLFWSGSLMATEIIVREGELTLSKAEVEFALAGSPRQIRDSVQSDEASRYEFFVSLLVSKKILAELQALDALEDPIAYHQFL